MASVAAGCAVVPDPIQPTFRGVWQSLWKKDHTAGATLNPALRYLRVTIDGQVSLFVLGELDADPRFAGIPVVMHSSLSADANRAMGQSVGVDAYVAKFDPAVLADTLRPMLAAHAAVN